MSDNEIEQFITSDSEDEALFEKPAPAPEPKKPEPEPTPKKPEPHQPHSTQPRVPKGRAKMTAERKQQLREAREQKKQALQEAAYDKMYNQIYSRLETKFSNER